VLVEPTVASETDELEKIGQGMVVTVASGRVNFILAINQQQNGRPSLK
jgi:hypothetical protein